MADVTLTRTSTLPDSSDKADFYTLIDTTTATVSNIVNADISTTAAIADSKLATIMTAGKVSASALTNMTSLVSAAGIIPSANLDINGTIFKSLASIPASAGVIPIANISSSVFTSIQVGQISKDLSAADANQDVSITGNPRAVILHGIVADGTTVPASTLFYDGTSNAAFYGSTNTLSSNVVFILYSSASNGQSGLVTLGTNKFTIGWTKVGSGTGTAYINYIAFV